MLNFSLIFAVACGTMLLILILTEVAEISVHSDTISSTNDEQLFSELGNKKFDPNIDIVDPR